MNNKINIKQEKAFKLELHAAFRERKKKERQRQRQKERDREREREKKTERERDRKTERKKKTETETEREIERKTERHRESIFNCLPKKPSWIFLAKFKKEKYVFPSIMTETFKFKGNYFYNQK